MTSSFSVRRLRNPEAHRTVGGVTHLVLLRHGSSHANLDNRFGGWDDVQLADAGIRQARAAGALLRRTDVEVAVAFTSVLARAKQTLQHCLETMGQGSIPCLSDWRLNERHYGALQGLSKSDAESRFGKTQVQRWRRGFHDRPPMLAPGDARDSFGALLYAGLTREQVPLGESLQDTQRRVVACWAERIVPALSSSGSVLVVAHGNSLRALLMVVEGFTEQEIVQREVLNGLPMIYAVHGAATSPSFERCALTALTSP